MKRRDFNRFALGIGLSPILANAQVFGPSLMKDNCLHWNWFSPILANAQLSGKQKPWHKSRGETMLEFDDIQHIVVTRVPALTGRYEFLSFRQAAQGRAWLAGMLDKVASVQQARDSIEREQRWVSVAFTWQGLRALGVDEQALATSRKNSGRAWSRARKCLAIQAETIPIGGLAASPVRSCTPSRFFSRAMRLSASVYQGTPGVLGKDPGCRSAFITGPRRHSAI